MACDRGLAYDLLGQQRVFTGTVQREADRFLEAVSVILRIARAVDQQDRVIDDHAENHPEHEEATGAARECQPARRPARNHSRRSLVPPRPQVSAGWC